MAAARRALAAQYRTALRDAAAPTAGALAAREAPLLKEKYREALVEWVVLNRDAETGAYPDLPTPERGGVKAILDPPEEADDVAAAAAAAAIPLTSNGLMAQIPF